MWIGKFSVSVGELRKFFAVMNWTPRNCSRGLYTTCSSEIISVNYNIFMGASPVQISRCSGWMILVFGGICCDLCVLLGFCWGFIGVLVSLLVLPAFSFLLQNLKVPVPDEISLELGRLLCLWEWEAEGGLTQENDFNKVIYWRWGLFPEE